MITKIVLSMDLNYQTFSINPETCFCKIADTLNHDFSITLLKVAGPFVIFYLRLSVVGTLIHRLLLLGLHEFPLTEHSTNTRF